MRNFFNTIRARFGQRYDADPRKLWRKYLIALTAIIAVLFFIHAAQITALLRSDNDAEIINESGRQRMLSQRTLYYAERFASTGAATAAERLAATVDHFEAAHIDIAAHAASSPDIATMYVGDDPNAVDTLSIRFIGLARAVLDAPPDARRAAVTHLSQLGEDLLLQRLNAAVAAFEQEARGNAERLRSLQEWALLAAALILLIEGLIIFWPAHRTVVRSLDDLEQRTRELQKSEEVLRLRNKELEAAQDQLLFAALHDPLTGLGNRRKLHEALHAKLVDNGPPLALHYLDLNAFKPINDTYGHAAGDAVLEEVARRLTHVAGFRDLVARVGGDEFVLLQMDPGGTVGVERVAARLLAAFDPPMRILQKHMSVRTSVGCVVHPGGAISADHLLARADEALYEAKAAHDDSPRFRQSA